MSSSRSSLFHALHALAASRRFCHHAPCAPCAPRDAGHPAHRHGRTRNHVSLHASMSSQSCSHAPHATQAIWLITTGARESAFRNIKTIAECLADELVNAAKGSSNRCGAACCLAHGLGCVAQQCPAWHLLQRSDTGSLGAGARPSCVWVRRGGVWWGYGGWGGLAESSPMAWLTAGQTKHLPHPSPCLPAATRSRRRTRLSAWPRPTAEGAALAVAPRRRAAARGGAGLAWRRRRRAACGGRGGGGQLGEEGEAGPRGRRRAPTRTAAWAAARTPPGAGGSGGWGSAVPACLYVRCAVCSSPRRRRRRGMM